MKTSFTRLVGLFLIAFAAIALVLGVSSTPSAMAAEQVSPAAVSYAAVSTSGITATLPITLTGAQMGNSPDVLAQMWNGAFGFLNQIFSWISGADVHFGQLDAENAARKAENAALGSAFNDLQIQVNDQQTQIDAIQAAGFVTGTLNPASLFAQVVVTSTTPPLGTLNFGGRIWPAGSVHFTATLWINGVATLNERYDVIYDPTQGGSSDHAALGWYYQPLLPGSDREAHDVAIVLIPGNYKFTGPECRVWLNGDGNSPWEAGTLLADRTNVMTLTVPATGALSESWVGVKCAKSDASGFSFEFLGGGQ